MENLITAELTKNEKVVTLDRVLYSSASSIEDQRAVENR